MDKIRLIGGPLGEITIQADEVKGSRIYVGGYLYVWNKKLDKRNYKEFEYVGINALDRTGWEDDGGR